MSISHETNDELRQRIKDLEQQLQALKDAVAPLQSDLDPLSLLGRSQEKFVLPAESYHRSQTSISSSSGENGHNLHLDREKRPLNSTVVPANCENAAPLRYHPEIDYQDSEQLFRAYVETANDMVYTVDMAGGLTFINSYGQKLLGCNETEWLGRPYLDFVAQNDRQRTAEAFALLMQTGELVDFEFALQPKTGSEIYMQVNGRLLYRNQQLIGGMGIARDVTERKRFEKQLQMFLKAVESAYDSAIITDLNGQIQYANPAASRMFGYNLDALSGKNIAIFYPEDGQEQVRWLIQRAAAGGWSGEFICQRYNGDRFPALVSVGPICNENGQPSAVSFISRDITSQKQTQAELAAKNIELERANRLKSEFLANMSHELRTPLTAVLGFSSLLGQQIFGELNAKQALYVRQIHQSGKHLLNLINDVLDLSKVEAGQIVLDIAPIAVPQFCEATLALVQEQARSRGISIHKSIQTNLIPLMADELRVRQMLLNLLSNAIKFSNEHSNIGLDVTSQGGYLVLAVWDEGIGIPESQHTLLFQPFQQLDSSLSRRHEGTGLGLALTRQLAELHGGTVEVESQMGQGSRFTIRLPLKLHQPSEEKLQPLPVSETLLSTASESQTSSCVLVVEDNSQNSMLLKDLLQHWGYEVYCAVDGCQALAWLGSHSADLILLDIQLPGLDGFEIIRRIRANPVWCKIPVVATTALAMVGDRDRCLAAGMQDYISKPIDYDILATILAKYTRHRPLRPVTT